MFLSVGPAKAQFVMLCKLAVMVPAPKYFWFECDEEPKELKLIFI